MTQKFNYDGYTVTATFRNDNSLSMTATYNLTGQNFINEMVELGKIKKDTVLATLSRKSQKNLRCAFKMIDSEPRKLKISFIVSFDYLPQFSEDITLDYLQIKADVLNKISSLQLHSDIQEVQKLLDSIKTNGTLNLQQKNTSVSSKTDITQYQLQKGQYLLQVTGVLTNAAVLHDTLEFFIERNGEQPISVKLKSHSQHGYGYPYCFSQKLQVQKPGKVQLAVKNGSGTSTLSGQIITLTPIVAI